MDIAFASAVAEDAAAIFDLCRSLIDAYEDISAINYDSALSWLGVKIQTNISTYKRIMVGDDVVGFFRLEKLGNKYELDDFYILPEYRNAGIGTAVLEKLCRPNRCIFLYVFTNNIGAIRLYKRFGFDVVKTVSPTRQIMEKPG